MRYLSVYISRVIGYLSLLTIWPMRLTQGRIMLKNKSNETLKKHRFLAPVWHCNLAAACRGNSAVVSFYRKRAK